MLLFCECRRLAVRARGFCCTLWQCVRSEVEVKGSKGPSPIVKEILAKPQFSQRARDLIIPTLRPKIPTLADDSAAFVWRMLRPVPFSILPMEYFAFHEHLRHKEAYCGSI